MPGVNLDDAVQWCGTVCFLTMYGLMSFNQYPWNILAGFLGGGFYLIWSVRTANTPQTVTNLVSVTICALGLIKAFV
jgi:hypothetical protein